MTRLHEIQVLQDEIAKAITDCETWRATGFTEQYFQAYTFVEALELQMARLIKPALP